MALDQMIAIQLCPPHPYIKQLSESDLLKQMQLFEEWFLKEFLDYHPNKKQKSNLNSLYKDIAECLLKQPQVLCHFDFESRNLMLTKDGKAGILDYQDARTGPIMLDPASLFRDLYKNWSEKEVYNYLKMYISKANSIGLLEGSTNSMVKWFDFCCLQRQLRILGTLARLHLRDNKSFRLIDLPKSLEFTLAVARKYKTLEDFALFLDRDISPLLDINLKNLK